MTVVFISERGISNDDQVGKGVVKPRIKKSEFIGVERLYPKFIL